MVVINNTMLYFADCNFSTFNTSVACAASSEPLLFPLLLIGIWIITFIATKAFTTPRAWTMASFICFILALPMVMMGWMASMYMYAFLVMTAIGIAWTMMDNSIG